MFKVIALFTVLLFSAHIESAEYPSHVGKSPFSFDKINTPSNTFVVSDKGQDNDVYLKRDDAKIFDLQFSLKIDRYVGDVSKLKENKLISDKFKISLPVFDVDNESALEDCDYDGELDTLAAEIDEVYFNGEKIGVLSGSNELWSENTFELDISKLNLPTSPGEVSENLVQIRIDTGNEFVELSSGAIGCQKWAVEVDYVTLEYKVADPVLLAIGLLGDPAIFGDEQSKYETRIKELGLPVKVIGHGKHASTKSCVGRNAPSLIDHGNNIYQKAIEFATELKTNKFNVIAHSKGGLDSRWFIDRLTKEKLLVQVGEMDNKVVRDTLLVNSLVTHSTPHYGTVLADAIDEGFYVGSIFSGLIKMNIDDICDLRTDTATEFTNSKRITDAIKFLAIGANIDANNDGKISDEESLHNQLRTDVIDYSGSAYRLIRDVKEYVVKLRPGTGQWPTEGNAVYVPYVEAVPNISPEPNDSLVSISSASPSDAMKVEKTVGNHATVLYGQSWHQVWTGAQDIVIDEAIVGMLKWSVGNETH